MARLTRLAMVLAAGQFISTASAQPANDNWVNAELLPGDFGTVDADTSGATAEPGEPSHAGYPARASVWYKWQPTVTGPVQLDTFNSSIDTVLAVYTAPTAGNSISALNFVVANDDINPSYSGTTAPWIGPSGVKFNAQQGVTYYIAVDGYGGTSGQIELSWAYRSAGVFRFTADLYQCGETESGAAGADGTSSTTCSWTALGMLVTATRDMGSVGRVELTFDCVDGTATVGTDYRVPANTTLVLDDFEMSKSFVIPIVDDGGICQPNRQFDVVLTSVVLDPLEADANAILPPRLNLAHSDAAVQIIDVDYSPRDPLATNCPVAGQVNFLRANCRTTEKIGSARVAVTRYGGGESWEIHYSIDSSPAISVNLLDNVFTLTAGADYATPNPPTDPWYGVLEHFEPVNGTLTWGQGDNRPKFIDIPIYDNQIAQFNEDMRIKLYQIPGHTTDNSIGNLGEMTLTILYDDYPAGALDDAYNPDFNILTNPPRNSKPGVNGVVYALAMQTDDKSIIAGHFSTYNTIGRNGIVRANLNGSLDTTFNPGSGVPVNQGDFISSLALAPDGKILVGGKFSSFNGTPRYGIARLNANGSLDASFNPGLGAGRSNVWAVALQSDGKVIVGGDFTSMNGVNRSHIARLNDDGSLDATFDPGTAGPDGVVRAVAVTANDQVILGGQFTFLGGFSRNIARLNTDGTVDTSFDPGTGVDGPVYALALQFDGKVLIGGAFNYVSTYNRQNIARLNDDATVDLSFDPGSGTDDSVYSITLASGGEIYLGGVFTSYNGTRRISAARLFATGEVDTGWLDTAYNQFAGPYQPVWNPDVNPKDFLFATALQSDGKLMIGGSFSYVGGGRLTAEVQTNAVSPVDLISGVNNSGSSRATFRSRASVARLLGGSTVGPGSMGLVVTNYDANENMGFLYVKLVRNNGTLGPIQSTFSLPPRSPGPGVAQSGVDYIYNRVNDPQFWSSWLANTRMLSDGVYGTNNNTQTVVTGLYDNATYDDVYVTILDRAGFQGDRSVPFQLATPSMSDVFYLGGENIPCASALAASSALLTVAENDVRPGVIGFSAATYSVDEPRTNTTTTLITLTRTNGSFGRVTARFATTNGTGVAGVNYTGVTNTVTFQDGELTRTVSITIKNDGINQPADKTVNLYLATPGNGATLGLSNAVLAIVDSGYQPGRLNFTPNTYATNESAGSVSLTVTRNGGNLGTMDVQYRTVNGTAASGVNYLGVTNALHWDSGDSGPRQVTIPVIHDGLVTPDKTFQVQLFNPQVIGTNALQALGLRTNATVTIINEDFYGTFQFSTADYFVNELGGFATITVNRTGGSAENVTVNFATYNTGGGATAGVNYTATNGTLFFGPGEIAKSFVVPIIYQPTQGGAGPYNSTDFGVAINGVVPGGAAVGSINPITVHIIDAELVSGSPGSPDPIFDASVGMNNDVYSLALQPDGKIVAGGNFTTVLGANYGYLARLKPDCTLDGEFLSGLAGANALVRTVINQTDSRVVVGGAFTTMDSVNRNYIARLNYDGSLDTGFNPGSGTDNPVYALGESWVNGARKIVLGGSFTSFNGVGRNSVARLNDDGTLDTGFNPGLGANNVVYAVAVYPTNTVNGGKVLIGGDFTSINGTPYWRIARLNVDGSLDATFNPGQGADAAVRAIAIQADGGILLGGSFTNYNGVVVNGITRLNSNGSRDTTFTSQPGANGTIFALAVQADQRILLVGEFTTASGVTRHRITRLLASGKVDPTINFGLGANNFINAIAVQTNQNLVIGGGFTDFNGTPMNRIGRLFGGSMTGSGSLEFTAANYSTLQSQTNTFISVRRLGGTSGLTPGGSVSVLFATADGTAVAGTNYLGVTNTLAFPEGEVFMSVPLVVINNLLIEPDRTVKLSLSNPQPPGGPVLGPQPTATLTIINDNSAVSFFSASYTAIKGSVDNAASIQIVRSGYLANSVSVEFKTVPGGTAIPGLDYLPVTNLVTFLPGQSNALVKIQLTTNTLVRGSQTVALELADSSGALLLDPVAATLTIVDTSTAPGRLMFSATGYSALEDQGAATITVLRTNGHTGVVTVNFLTLPNTAVAGVDYTPTNGTLVFGDGETTKSFTVPVLNDGVVGSDKSLLLVLTNETGGATIAGSSVAPLTIVENNRGFALSSPVYVANEGDGNLTVTVRRLGATNGLLFVNISTTNGTAVAGVDFAGVNGPLVFNPGETFKLVTIPITFRPGIQGDRTFYVNLTPPISTSANIGDPAVATVYILDSDTGFSFGTNSYSVLKSGGSLMVTVLRTNANTGTASVMYATSDGTARGGVNYTPVLGTLDFANGEDFKTFTVPILSNNLVEGDLTFNLQLSTPLPGSNATLVVPSSAVATIVDDNAGLRFSSSGYFVNKDGVHATINVFRSNFTNSTVSVDYQTLDGTAKAGQDYVATSGTLFFPYGVTNRSFTVTIIDNSAIRGDHTVLLSLFNPGGAAALVNPSASTLTIIDNGGSLVTAAGSALITEGLGKTNGVIDPGETVTLLLALRNTVGASTTNLTATLLATNGITTPSGPQNYGALLPGGPSVSRPFTFTAGATNGQPITATLSLKDGSLNLGAVTFVYMVGTSTRSFTNNTLITIPSYGAATPYPSTNDIEGLDGVVNQLTLTLSDLQHRYPSDNNLLLVSPTGQKVVLMGNVGGGTVVTNLMLTLDDAAATALPLNPPLTNGTYRPANYRAGFNFGSFPPAPSMPYDTTLAAYNGSNPNGIWSLYVVDSSSPDSGSIGAWWLTLKTVNPVAPSCDASLTLLASPASVVLSSNLTYTLIVTNHGPGTATAVSVTDHLPAGAAYLSAAPSQGSVTTNGAGQVAWAVGSLAINASATLTLSTRTIAAGQLTNTASVALAQPDPNSANNLAAVVSTVVTASADLALGLVDAPDPLYLPGSITYSVSVTNFGPATAFGVVVADILPANLTYVSGTTSQGTISNQAGTVTGSLGSLGSGAQAYLTIIVQPTTADTITNTVGVSSPVLDPLKGNNVAAVKTVVLQPVVTMDRSGSNLIISWPADATGYQLKSATTLVPPVSWSLVPIVPVVSGGVKSVTVPITSGNQYFRLQAGP